MRRKMKFITITFLCIILALVIFAVYNNQDERKDLLSKFERWDMGQLEDAEGIKIMDSFKDYLIRHPEISTKDILNFSSFMKVYEKDNLRMIEYIENPLIYGSSARGSYHIVIYNDKVKMIDSNGSTIINEIVKVNEKLYHIYATDYRTTNITGINIYDISINENGIEYKPVISMDDLLFGFKYDDISHALYFDGGHIYYQEIKNNGNEVILRVDDMNYTLFYNEEDGLYHMEDSN
jgi:hypothetical protein